MVRILQPERYFEFVQKQGVFGEETVCGLVPFTAVFQVVQGAVQFGVRAGVNAQLDHRRSAQIYRLQRFPVVTIRGNRQKQIVDSGQAYSTGEVGWCSKDVHLPIQCIIIYQKLTNQHPCRIAPSCVMESCAVIASTVSQFPAWLSHASCLVTSRLPSSNCYSDMLWDWHKDGGNPAWRPSQIKRGRPDLLISSKSQLPAGTAEGPVLLKVRAFIARLSSRFAGSKNWPSLEPRAKPQNAVKSSALSGAQLLLAPAAVFSRMRHRNSRFQPLLPMHAAYFLQKARRTSRWAHHILRAYVGIQQITRTANYKCSFPIHTSGTHSQSVASGGSCAIRHLTGLRIQRSYEQNDWQ
ncbi:hypothetical protein SS50377_26198 [Spironucleus salmonicida]|uniref:Uncharacterized protein n=1 Tax=Spironucleus salmonicida TaxID=348837 RepID=V6LTL3_9EUKA|nr:hypothetical protein SS50377_26198 [Spironucleus salmonicida]|eukprot:EST47925.1 Hypothetical protein SS50377_11966 [Spironucleus salmonicida]